MKITSISISGSNPSMGPHEKKSEKTLNMADHQELAEDLLDNTTMNGVATLRKVLEYHIEGNETELKKVREAFKVDTDSLRQGERILSFNISIEGHPTLKI